MLKEIREELDVLLAICEGVPEDSTAEQFNEVLDDMANAISKLIWDIDKEIERRKVLIKSGQVKK